MARRMDLTGQRFGRLLVLSYAFSRGNGAWWRCRCDCGNEVDVSAQVLRRGTSRSCGCLRREVTTARNLKHGHRTRSAPVRTRGSAPVSTRKGRPQTHGASGTPTYNSWQQMITRTTRPDHPRYPDWGGRGITVCDQWRDFRNFLADMGERPPGTTLNRLNNDENYEPGNCEWSTPAEQARNQRRTKLTPAKIREIVTLHDSGLKVSQVAEQVGIDRHSIGTILAVARALAQ